MGQIVPPVKDNMSPVISEIGDNEPDMKTWIEQGQFEEALRARVIALRKAAKPRITQKQMADAIGIEFETYKKYETRSPMPAYLIPRFAEVIGQSILVVMGAEQAGFSVDNVAGKLADLMRTPPPGGWKEGHARWLAEGLGHALGLPTVDHANPPTQDGQARARPPATNQPDEGLSDT
jgi:DNA-binding XRE family transcriptional regulator